MKATGTGSSGKPRGKIHGVKELTLSPHGRSCARCLQKPILDGTRDQVPALTFIRIGNIASVVSYRPQTRTGQNTTFPHEK